MPLPIIAALMVAGGAPGYKLVLAAPPGWTKGWSGKYFLAGKDTFYEFLAEGPKRQILRIDIDKPSTGALDAELQFIRLPASIIASKYSLQTRYGRTRVYIYKLNNATACHALLRTQNFYLDFYYRAPASAASVEGIQEFCTSILKSLRVVKR